MSMSIFHYAFCCFCVLQQTCNNSGRGWQKRYTANKNSKKKTFQTKTAKATKNKRSNKNRRYIVLTKAKYAIALRKKID